jgi:hypothetical protein
VNFDPSDEEEGVFDGLRGGAILIGALLDLIVTQLGLSALQLAFAPALLSADLDARREMTAALMAQPGFPLAALAVGVLGTVIGAFVGARQAGQLFVRHGGWIAVASTVLGTFASLLDPTTAAPNALPPLWAQVASLLLILPAGVAGGALAGWLRRRPRP